MTTPMATIAITSLLYLLFMLYPSTFCLENGLARTPPMGWLAWERFKCNINCRSDPGNCISEKLFMEMADRLVEDGYRDAGYVYINVDDCWMARTRDSDGNMVPDPERFPHGIGYLADYMHKRGLKLGIYQDFGLFTCMGYPGIIGHMEQDAKTFAKWKVDMVKLDGCHSTLEHMNHGYPAFGKYLNLTGRPMVYSCSWPYYQFISRMDPDYKLISAHCNLWRNYHDITPSWKSILSTIDFFGDNQKVLSQHNGPGHWSDPDMLMIGNEPLLPGQARVQMAVWSILPAPLLMSNDLRQMHPAFKSILLNAKAIKINQDPLGLPGKRVYKGCVTFPYALDKLASYTGQVYQGDIMKNYVDVWTRPISPVKKKKTSYAILVLNRNKSKKLVKFLVRDLGMMNLSGYNCSSVFSDVKNRLLPNSQAIFSVKAMDAYMLNCEVV